MATLLGEPVAASLEDQWRVLLRNEFHDILPGSSIREVYAADRIRTDLGGHRRRSEIAGRTSPAIAGQLVGRGDKPGVLVVNPDLSPRPLRLVSSDALPGGQSGRGRHGRRRSNARSPASRPSWCLTIAAARRSRGRKPAPGECRSAGRTGRRRHACQRLRQARRAGGSRRPRQPDLGLCRQAAKLGRMGRRGRTMRARARSLWRPQRMEVVENGPHRAAIRIVRRFRDSEIVQTLRLWANSARLEFKTDIDWHERRILLKARFPLAIRSDHATFECAHGVDPAPDPPQHVVGAGPLRGRRPSLRRSLRARLWRGAAQ